VSHKGISIGLDENPIPTQQRGILTYDSIIRKGTKQTPDQMKWKKSIYLVIFLSQHRPKMTRLVRTQLNRRRQLSQR
jgi:hypothetical protein